MRFVENIPKEEYDNFTRNHEKSHFLQSYEWGQFCEAVKGQIAHYVGMRDDNEDLVATALILEKKTPLGYSYGYSPRGFLIDYMNKAYIKVFTGFLRQYMIDKKMIYIKFDPDIKYQDIDEEGKKIEGGENNYELYDYLKSLGYIHGGFYKLYEGNQPRYTFRINLKKPWEEIEQKFSKTFMKSIKRSAQYNIRIDNKVDVEGFYNLLQENSSKDGFDAKSKNFYEKFTEIMQDKNMKFFNAYIKPQELLENINKEIAEQESLLKTATKKQEDIKNKITRLNKEKEEFVKIEGEEVLICSLICTYTDNRAWSLYIGSNDLANLTFAVSLCYYEAIKDAFNRKLDFFDLFGVVGDPHTTYKNLARIYDFKRKFGDEYIEFIGEFDLVNKKFLYKILPFLLKIYRKLRG